MAKRVHSTKSGRHADVLVKMLTKGVPLWVKRTFPDTNGAPCDMAKKIQEYLKADFSKSAGPKDMSGKVSFGLGNFEKI